MPLSVLDSMIYSNKFSEVSVGGTPREALPEVAVSSEKRGKNE